MIAEINGTNIRIKNSIPPVQGAVGIKMRAAFSEEWSPLAVTAVFRAGTVQRDVIVEDGELTIPWEVLQKAGCPLYLNFYGAEDSGAVVLKTVQVELGTVAPSPDPSGETPEAPTPARADQIQALAEAALSTARQIQSQAESGAFNGKDGQDGADGRDGVNGTNGTDGVSPRITVSETAGGHTVHITDAAGERSFDVLDGAAGEVTRAELASALAAKADISGSYDSMSVGNAKQLVATVGVTDRVPYNFRTSGGSADVGDRASDKIVGGTLVWNQMLENGNMDSDSFRTKWHCTVALNDHVATITPTDVSGTTQYNNQLALTATAAPVVGHVYFATADYYPAHSKSIRIACFGHEGSSGSDFNPPSIQVEAGRWNTCQLVVKPTNTNSTFRSAFFVWLAMNADLGYSLTDADQIRRVMLIDLTQMFGSAIADYVYGLEQANAGAGAAWFRKLFPKSYYACNAGELMSVRVSAHETVGFNAYDHATGKAKLIGGAQYQITGAYTALSLNGETVTPNANGVFTPSESGNLTVTGGDSGTTCVHLVWSGYRNGEYEPYKKHTYALDSGVTLRGVPTLDSSSNLCFDGDTYESCGEVTRRYGLIDLGTLHWAYLQESWGNSFYSNSLQSTIKNNCINMICSKYKTGSWAQRTEDQILVSVAKQIRIIDSRYNDADALSAALSGVYFVYELENPSCEAADPYQNPQIVDDFGTEEYIDTRDVAIPVGHETFYAANLRDKLQNAPNNPDANGDYILRRRGSENSYVPLEEVKELPDAPTADGTYSLRVTISNGVAAYSWVSE